MKLGKTQSNTVNMDNKNIKNILKNQLSKGSSGLYDNAFDIVTYKFSEEDLMVIIPYLNDFLEKNGYEKPTKEQFKQIVQIVFGRIIDYDSPSSFLCINSNDNCDKRKRFVPNTNYMEIPFFTHYLIKQNYFFTDLYAIAEIIDYKQEFPEEYEYELQYKDYFLNTENEQIKINKWKDIVDLPQQREFNKEVLLHRNKFLFNNNHESFVWLTKNNPSFLNMLVNTFGYVQDTELLKWVLEENQSFYEKHSFNNNTFARALMIRLCNGKLLIHKKTLELISNNLNSNYLSQIENFIRCVASGDPYKEINFVEFSFQERAEIIACLIAWIETLIEKNEKLKNEYAGVFLTAFEQSAEFPKEFYFKEFKANNYYGLSDFWISHME